MTAFTHQVQAWTAYWRDSLADIEMRSPASMLGKWLLPEDIYRQGIFPESLTQLIFKEAERASRSKTDDELTELQVFISPLSVTQLRSHGRARTDDEVYEPFWIAAVLNRKGFLSPDPNLGPWFVREHLEPSKDDFAMLGTLADFDGFLTEHDPPTQGDWTDLLEYSGRLFKAVTGFHLQDYLDQDGVRKQRRVVLGNAKRGINAQILGLYGAVLRDRPDLPLLQSTVAPRQPKPAPKPYPACGTGVPRRHTAQMGSAFPLNASQRQALHALTQTPRGELLAINGPPGTGKTTLLQSVVASAWVNAAIEGDEPPVILACSSNNQAVTNILDTFAEATEVHDDDPWSKRWIPDIDSLGLYLPSSSRFKKTDYLAARPGFPAWQGLPERMESEEYVRRASVEFLGHARGALGEPQLDLERAVERLAESIGHNAELLGRALEAAHSTQLLRSTARVHGAAEASEHLETVISHAEGEIQRFGAALAAIRGAIARAPWYERALLGFGPTRKWAAQQISLRLAEVFHHHQIPELDIDPESFWQSIESHIDALSQPHRAILDRARLWQRTEKSFADCVRRLPNDEAQKTQLLDAPEGILPALDTGLRHRLFLLAARYYEGRWLVEMRSLLDESANLNAQSKEACEARWRRFAKLTPCVVSTFHSAPRAFDYYDPKAGAPRPLYDFIDLLIVDEAGQTTPQVAMATFALARRAVVVGDVKQIEPVWELPEYLDHANRRSHGLPEADSAADARSVSAGSVMLLAHHSTAFTVGLGEPGMWLNEHWRCVPKIIDYCNELAYHGHLIDRRKPLEQRVLPALGRAHVQSPAGRRGPSWVNVGEAEAIASWLATQRTALETFYDSKKIEEIVGVITPFAAQKHVLAKALEKAGLGGMTAGTVHTFQGAERPVIVFSPVYSYSGQGTYFFDRGPSMLNVALSRAKDSFLVIGDLRLFRASNRALPSGLLGHHLFASPESEIAGVSALPMRKKALVEQLTGLEDHTKALTRALNESRETVLIVSPFLRPRALDQAKDIEPLIEAAKYRGVDVIVFYNSTYHQQEADRKKAEEVAQRLLCVGADVRATEGIHLKTLAVDRRWLAHGSFNWLSAERSEKRWQNLEASFLYSGEEAEAWIQNIWKELIDQEYGDSRTSKALPKAAAPSESMSRAEVSEGPPETGAQAKRRTQKSYTHLTVKHLAEERGMETESLRARLVELGLVKLGEGTVGLTEAGKLAGGELKRGKYGPFLVWPRDIDLRGD